MKLIVFKDLKTLKGVPYTKAWTYKLIADNEFPRPVRLSENRVAWLESEIDAWITSHVSERDRVAA